MANIVDTAVSAGTFTKLVAAVKAAGLDGVLSQSGPFTVFAPSDSAFAKLPEGTCEDLLEDLPKLTNILKYHVVDGEYMSSDIGSMRTLRSLQGQDLTISTMGGPHVDEARIVNADIRAENGVIHVIDTVLLPE